MQKSPHLRATPSFLALCFLSAGLLLPAPAWSWVSPHRRTLIVQAVEKNRPAVVNIQGRKQVAADRLDTSGGDPFRRQVNGMGTGVIIDQRGYVLTNFHVIENVKQIRVTTADQKTHTARLIDHDPTTDLAVIKIDSQEKFPLVQLGISSDLMPGEPVVAVGNAFGYHYTVTRGIISALHREVQVSAHQKYHDLIQTDASINPGNSGGPLLNIDGRMIGVNVAVRVGAQGIGFAIPVDEALEAAAKLMTTERIDKVSHGVIGETKQHGERRFFQVQRVRDKGPGQRCGLRTGDVITSVDGRAIQRSLDFERALLGHRPNATVLLNILRDNEALKLHLTLQDARQFAQPFDQQAWQVLGVKLEAIAQNDFQTVNANSNANYRGGLRVLAVRPDSPAFQQGIKAGDVLVGMHVWETVSEDNVQYILNRPNFEDLQPIKFFIVRGAETLYGQLKVQLTAGDRRHGRYHR